MHAYIHASIHAYIHAGNVGAGSDAREIRAERAPRIHDKGGACGVCGVVRVGVMVRALYYLLSEYTTTTRFRGGGG